MTDPLDSVEAMNKHAAKFASPYSASNRIQEAAGARGRGSGTNLDYSSMDIVDGIPDDFELDYENAIEDTTDNFSDDGRRVIRRGSGKSIGSSKSVASGKSLKSRKGGENSLKRQNSGKGLSSGNSLSSSKSRQSRGTSSVKSLGSMKRMGNSSHMEQTEEITDEEEIVVIKTTQQRLKEAERIIASEVFYTNDVPESISQWSLSAALFQCAQSLLLFLIATRAEEVQWHWYVNYPNPSNPDSEGLLPKPDEVAAFSVLWLVPFVTLLSGMEHLCCVLFRETYEWYIARHQNPFRWTEYSFSAPLMKIIIAQQVGITDIHLLICIFMLMAVSIQCAATHENVNSKARSEHRPQNWRPFFTGWMGHLTAWVIIWNYFSVYTSRGGTGAEVWTIIIVMFLLDTSFAVLFFLQWRRIGPFDDYVVGEKGFITLSFTAKTLLAWISVANAMEG